MDLAKLFLQKGSKNFVRIIQPLFYFFSTDLSFFHIYFTFFLHLPVDKVDNFVYNSTNCRFLRSFRQFLQKNLPLSYPQKSQVYPHKNLHISNATFQILIKAL